MHFSLVRLSTMKSKNGILFCISLVLIASVSSCSINSQKSPPVAPQSSTQEKTNTVAASYYGEKDGLDGKKTASGEKFDSNDFTAAHRSYPFGTVLKVTNPDTGKDVKVRVNDRGPFRKGRDIDLSAGAAHAIGLEKDGVSKVKVEVVEGAKGSAKESDEHPAAPKTVEKSAENK